MLCNIQKKIQKVVWRNQENCKKQKQKNDLLCLKPRLIFIDECEKMKLFIYLDKIAVKEYRVIFPLY